MEEKKIGQEKARKVFLDGLPRWTKGENAKAKDSSINWNASIGYKIKFMYNNIEGYFSILNYDKKYLYVQYLNYEVFKISTDSVLHCKLGGLLKKRTTDFKIKIGTHYKDKKRDIVIIDSEIRKEIYKSREINKKYYKYYCNKDKNEDWVEEYNLLHGVGCSCCNNKVVVQGINDIPTTNPELVKYFQGGYDEAKLYTKNGGGNPKNRYGRIYPICPDCGKIRKKKVSIGNIYKTHSIGCDCSDKISYPNKFAHNVLEQLNNIYKFDYLEFEYSPDWIGRRLYDNYFVYNNKEYIIEMDGGLGHGKKDNLMNNQTKEESKYIDDEKDRLANEHGIEVIRIDCEISDLEYIKNNMLKNKKLNNLFDFSKVDWFNVEEFSLSNMIKTICEEWRDNTNITTGYLNKKYKISPPSIIRWLKKGSKLGWCHYDSKEEQRKICSKNGMSNRKPIKSIETKICFNAVSDCARKSLDVFGITMTQSGISISIKDNRPYKGYTFIYITENEYNDYLKTSN